MHCKTLFNEPQVPVIIIMYSFFVFITQVYFGTSHARIYLVADCIGINCPTGMSALMRKKLLEEVRFIFFLFHIG